jgi:hypothetical protein
MVVSSWASCFAIIVFRTSAYHRRYPRNTLELILIDASRSNLTSVDYSLFTFHDIDFGSTIANMPVAAKSFWPVFAAFMGTFPLQLVLKVHDGF